MDVSENFCLFMPLRLAAKLVEVGGKTNLFQAVFGFVFWSDQPRFPPVLL